MIPRNTPQNVADLPVVQYSSGHTERRVGQRFAGFVGFYVEQGKYSAFDQVAAAAEVEAIEVRHPRGQGKYEHKRHWLLGERLVFYPVTAGPPATTISGCLALAQQTAEAGIGLSWPSGEKSRMAVRGIVVLGRAPIVVQLSTKSTMTGFFLAALLDHYRACAAADSLIKRDAHPAPVAFYEIGLPLLAGPDQSVGGDATAQVAPIVSGHPAQLDRDYVTAAWARSPIPQLAGDAWAEIRVWAAGYRSGETNGDSHL
jgi:hypothetical protein